MIGTINTLILNKEEESIKIDGFTNIDKNGEITFCMEEQGVFIYNGIMNPQKYTHYVTKLRNGKTYNKLIYQMLEDRGLNQENLFMMCGNNYFETLPHPYVE